MKKLTILFFLSSIFMLGGCVSTGYYVDDYPGYYSGRYYTSSYYEPDYYYTPTYYSYPSGYYGVYPSYYGRSWYFW